jgi:acyl-coenzyme A thioesterase PaaI-like protein
MSEPTTDLLHTAPDNVFSRIARRHTGRAPAERKRLLARDVGEAIPFVGTAGLGVEVLRPTRVVATLTPGRATQNHIGGTHAGAMALLAETATGLIVAQNVPEESVPVLRSLDVAFQRRAEGALRATARLSVVKVERIRARPIGKVEASVAVADASGEAPIEATLRWAWLPRRRAGLE